MQSTYTPAQDADILEGRKIGLTYDEIAVLVGRPSGYSVRARYQILTDRSPAPRKARSTKRKDRRCLGAGCGRMFRSTGPGNRLCGRCRPRCESISPYEPDAIDAEPVHEGIRPLPTFGYR